MPNGRTQKLFDDNYYDETSPPPQAIGAWTWRLRNFHYFDHHTTDDYDALGDDGDDDSRPLEPGHGD